MSNNLELVTEWLCHAACEVGPNYFQLPVAGQEEPEYRERVYCYELYHRWRSRWPNDFPFSLGGEIDKTGHPLIRGNHKPVFLVHVPGQMTNLLVMEVKPANAGTAQLVNDLKKLTRFRRAPANYEAAYLLIYGMTPAGWAVSAKRLAPHIAAEPEIEIGTISCLIHSAVGERVVPAPW
jgi:hypothetical protein